MRFRLEFAGEDEQELLEIGMADLAAESLQQIEQQLLAFLKHNGGYPG